jgi:hypothetical protein
MTAIAELDIAAQPNGTDAVAVTIYPFEPIGTASRLTGSEKAGPATPERSAPGPLTLIATVPSESAVPVMKALRPTTEASTDDMLTESLEGHELPPPPEPPPEPPSEPPPEPPPPEPEHCNSQ